MLNNQTGNGSGNNHPLNSSDETINSSHIIDSFTNLYESKVNVVEKNGTRFLMSENGLHYGGNYISQDGDVTPFSMNRSINTMMMMPILFPYKHRELNILIAGLGAGCSPVILLSMFTNIKITVVEIDPFVIAAARKHFPLLSQYEQTGTLEIINDDLFRWLETQGAENKYDITQLDIFSNSDITADIYKIDPLRKINHLSRSVWLNMYADTYNGDPIDRLSAFNTAGLYFKGIFTDLSDNRGTAHKNLTNYVLSTDEFVIPTSKERKMAFAQILKYYEILLPVLPEYYKFHPTNQTLDLHHKILWSQTTGVK